MLEVFDLHAGYGKVRVLQGVSLEVQRGQVVTLIGANGAGKTTTMRAISGMLKPSSGRVTLNGREIGGSVSHHIAKAGIAHSPEGRRVFGTLSVLDNIRVGAFCRYTGSRPGNDIPSDIHRVLTLFPRLSERRHQLAGTLSGGEQQMLAIARALMSNPDVLLLDEPSMGLAPIIVEEVFQIIRELKSQGMTMLIVEQFAAAALQIADFGYVMENGRIVVHGPARDLAKDPALIAAYLGGH